MAQNVVKNPNLNLAEIGVQEELTTRQQSTEATAAVSQKSSGEVGGEVLLFFHPDHLGSTSYVTDDKGKLFEHLQYFPFGETWVQEAKTGRNTPYLFTSKELDQETGLYYFGARYYDPRTSVWITADPALGKFLPTEAGQWNLPGLGGVYNSRNLGLYTYTQLNPERMTDPDGEFGILGAIVGAAPDITVQVILIKSGAQESFDPVSLFVSAGAGFVGGGVVSGAARLASVANKFGKAATVASNFVAKSGAEAALSAGSSKLKGDPVTPEGVLLNVALGKAGGKIGTAIGRARTAKSTTLAGLKKVANRADRTATRTEARGRRPGRARAKRGQADAAQAKADDFASGSKAGIIGSSIGSKTGGAIDKAFLSDPNGS